MSPTLAPLEALVRPRVVDPRKANLCGVDLRGARIDDVDFYLVDLRGAMLDQAQRDYLQQCRAILDD